MGLAVGSIPLRLTTQESIRVSLDCRGALGVWGRNRPLRIVCSALTVGTKDSLGNSGACLVGPTHLARCVPPPTQPSCLY